MPRRCQGNEKGDNAGPPDAPQRGNQLREITFQRDGRPSRYPLTCCQEHRTERDVYRRLRFQSVKGILLRRFGILEVESIQIYSFTNEHHLKSIQEIMNLMQQKYKWGELSGRLCKRS